MYERSYIWTAQKDMKASVIIAVKHINGFEMHLFQALIWIFIEALAALDTFTNAYFVDLIKVQWNEENVWTACESGIPHS